MMAETTTEWVAKEIASFTKSGNDLLDLARRCYAMRDVLRAQFPTTAAAWDTRGNNLTAKAQLFFALASQYLRMTPEQREAKRREIQSAVAAIMQELTTHRLTGKLEEHDLLADITNWAANTAGGLAGSFGSGLLTGLFGSLRRAFIPTVVGLVVIYFGWKFYSKRKREVEDAATKVAAAVVKKSSPIGGLSYRRRRR